MRKPVKHKSNYFVASTENRRAKSRKAKINSSPNRPAGPLSEAFALCSATEPRGVARGRVHRSGKGAHRAPEPGRSAGHRPGSWLELNPDSPRQCSALRSRNNLHDPKIPQWHHELATHRSADSLVREFLG